MLLVGLRAISMCLATEAVTPREGICADREFVHHRLHYVRFVPRELDPDHGYRLAQGSDIDLAIQTRYFM